jgi:hypothetical protein
MNKQTKLAMVAALGAVMLFYILISYCTVGIQNTIRQALGVRDSAAYDTVEATVLASTAIVMATGMFLFMSNLFSGARLLRGFLSGLVVIVPGSAAGRYLHNPADPANGLLAVTLTIFIGAGVAMFFALRHKNAASPG